MSTELEILEATSAQDVVDETSTIEAAASSSSLGVSVDTRIYRSYGIYDEKNEIYALGVKDEKGNQRRFDQAIVRQQDNAGGKSWKELEEAGNTKLSENSYLFHTIESEEGFAELIPDATQRLYIIQKGITSLETGKANQLQAEIDTTTKTMAHIDETIDLRDFLNDTTSKRKLTDSQKVLRDISALAPDAKAALIAQLQAMLMGN